MSIKLTLDDFPKVEPEKEPNYRLGRYARLALEGKELFDGGDDPLELAKKGTRIAFGSVGTGPTEEHRNATLVYFVEDKDGDAVFSVTVTPEGQGIILEKAKSLLRDNKSLLRAWAYKDDLGQNSKYCREADTILSGDISYLVDQIVCSKIKLGDYLFDSNPENWSHILAGGHGLTEADVDRTPSSNRPEP
jgi:hypothetical protein